VIQLSEKSCSKCGKKLPAHARFCESCGALVEEPPVKEDLRGRFYARLWKVLFYPFVICFVASAVLYWLSHGLEYRGLIGWAWMGMMTPLIVLFGFLGFMALFHRKTFRTTKEYILFSLIFLGVSIVLLVYAVLVFLGLLPFPFIEFGS
jgi:small-conductance mechanosensitive channel